jgi:hypothetical protein
MSLVPLSSDVSISPFDVFVKAFFVDVSLLFKLLNTMTYKLFLMDMCSLETGQCCCSNDFDLYFMSIEKCYFRSLNQYFFEFTVSEEPH